MPKTKKIGNILNYVFDGWKCRDFCEEAIGPDPTGLGLNCSDEIRECLKRLPEIRNDIYYFGYLLYSLYYIANTLKSL